MINDEVKREPNSPQPLGSERLASAKSMGCRCPHPPATTTRHSCGCHEELLSTDGRTRIERPGSSIIQIPAMDFLVDPHISHAPADSQEPDVLEGTDASRIAYVPSFPNSLTFSNHFPGEIALPTQGFRTPGLTDSITCDCRLRITGIQATIEQTPGFRMFIDKEKAIDFTGTMKVNVRYTIAYQWVTLVSVEATLGVGVVIHDIFGDVVFRDVAGGRRRRTDAPPPKETIRHKTSAVSFPIRTDARAWVVPLECDMKTVSGSVDQIFAGGSIRFLTDEFLTEYMTTQGGGFTDETQQVDLYPELSEKVIVLTVLVKAVSNLPECKDEWYKVWTYAYPVVSRPRLWARDPIKSIKKFEREPAPWQKA